MPGYGGPRRWLSERDVCDRWGKTEDELLGMVMAGELGQWRTRPGVAGRWWRVADVQESEEKLQAAGKGPGAAASAVDVALDASMTMEERQEAIRWAMYRGLIDHGILSNLMRLAKDENPQIAIRATQVLLDKTVPSLTRVEKQEAVTPEAEARAERVTKALEIIAAHQGKVIEVGEYRVIADEGARPDADPLSPDATGREAAHA